MRLRSAANLREHWRVKALRVKRERTVISLEWRKLKGHPEAALLQQFPLVVTFTRIAPRLFDTDNIRGAFKAIRDEVSKQLGVDDRVSDQRVTFDYGQEQGGKGVYAIRIDIAHRPFGCPWCRSSSIAHPLDCPCTCHAKNRSGE